MPWWSFGSVGRMKLSINPFFFSHLTKKAARKTGKAEAISLCDTDI
jgi:hypothetical protein